MPADTQRSEQVIEAYKKNKHASNALRRIHYLIRGYDEEHASNRRLACVGLIVVLVLVSVAAYLLLNSQSITLP